ncbi:MAG: extracellular solute-binding protein family 1 [Paenibacillus sp.]|jgi:multiple sugar transport system substrate-binding protein|uniref:ABC transporter substrate-binding protein n=1 Tax=Paenibacillus sp. GCM10012303 TaxID=3317340 RepID=UPI0029EAED6C|nr:extracellular solute-binding protein family 1 [Paenibacillus sp.]
MKTKNAWNLIWLPLLAVSLTACGSGPSGKDADTSQSAASPLPGAAPKQPEPVTLTFFEPSSGRSVEWFMDLYGNAIQKKFPHVKVEFKYTQKINDKNVGLQEMIASGSNDIDVIVTSVGSFIPAIIDNGLTFDHSELIKTNKYDLSLLDPTPIQLLQELSGGGLLGLPVGATANALVYNKDLFDKFGVSYPKDGMTWDEVYDLAVKLTRKDGEIQYRGFVASHSHVALVNQFSASYVDPVTKKALMNADPNWAKHSQNLKRFHQIPGNEVNASTVGLAHAQFTVEKTAAMYVNSLDATFLNPQTYGINMDAVSMPEYKELPGIGSQLYPTYFSIINTSKKKEAAFQVLAYLTSEEWQLERAKQGFTPIVKSQAVRNAVGQDIPYLQGKNAKAFTPAKPAKPSKLTEFNATANSLFLTELRKYIIGDIDLNTMLRNTDEQINAKIAEAGAAKK